MKLVGAVVAAAALAGCGGAASRWVESAREANASADALIARGEIGRASEVLLGLVSEEPAPGVAAQDARAVLQDAHARLADLQLGQGRPEEALRYTEKGLGLGAEKSVFGSSLHLLRGRAYEALGRDGDAAREYETAQAIAMALLGELTGDGGLR